ncbi:glycosyl hydrolase [Candidatus Pristimantibacillus sp. PTI5]|uniref:glycosyl hydrolase n=1 Tax=Candidatus Pristimantibacillus sp. PTI5 TaxID=3400422 RepID=UPI003B01C143
MKEIVRQFQSPSKRFRPKMRWWLPGAFMHNDEIKREIEWLVSAGYGGAEIIDFFAIPTADVDKADYGKYGFGSDEWNDRMKAALEVAIPLDFQLDFTVGPLWPIATPAIKDRNDYRCTQGLHVGTLSFTGSFKGPIPASETVDLERTCKLVAVTAARKHVGASVGKRITLDLDSAVDLSSLVSVDGSGHRLAWTPPSEGEWCLFGFWSQTNGQMNDSATAPVLDHFSKDSVDAVVGYWDERLFSDPVIRALYEKNAGCLFCDSIELNATMLGGMYGGTPMPVAIWTRELLNEFRMRRGYHLAPYLPSIFISGLYQLSDRNPDGDSEYDFSDRSANHRIRNDFFLTLTDMFRDNHLRALREWANRHNMKLRYQTYGLPTELTSGLMEVDVPETESLGFGDSTDGYRFQSGAVHIAAREIYSMEVGAVMGYGYKQTWTGHDFGLLWQLHRGFAAGVNQAVMHGMSYESASAAGHFAEAFQWPGLSLMGTMFSNEWGKRQPNSLHARDITDYMARNQFILRSGTPKVDLAIYRYHIDGVHHGMGTEQTVYEKAGYSYDFVSPALLAFDTAFIGTFDGHPALAADGPAYKAVIVDMRKNTDNGEWMPSDMPLETADRLITYAEAELPIILVGGGPDRTISYYGDRQRMETEDAELVQRIERLRAMPTVCSVQSQEDVAEALGQLSVTPAARVDGSQHVLSVRRSDLSANYYYLYNPSLEAAFDGDLYFIGEGRIYMLDAWNGKIQAMETESVAGGRVATKIRLAPNATVLIVVTPEAIQEIEAEKLAVPTVGETIELNSWTLSIESWTAGSVPTETKIEMIEMELEELRAWSDIPALQDKSGIGRYRTSFRLEESAESLTNAVLALGEVCDTFRVSVNGQVLQAVNQIERRVCIGTFLREGNNTIEIEVATTLNNALRLIDSKRQPQPYGLIGPVVIIK